MAIPKALVSRQMIKQMDGIKSIRTTLQPANSSGVQSFSANSNNKIIFQIPQYPNAFINTKRSYIRFKVKSGSADDNLHDGCPIFRRMVLKNTRTTLEDIDNYDVLCKIMEDFKTTEETKTLSYTHKVQKGLENATFEKQKAKEQALLNSDGQNVVHELHSGILGHYQEYLVPVHSLSAQSGYAMQLELYLNDNNKVFYKTTSTSNGAAPPVYTQNASGSYTVSDVAFELELVELPTNVLADINRELASGGEIPLPFKTWRNQTVALSGSGTKHQMLLQESAINVENILTVIKNQSHSAIVSAGTTLSTNEIRSSVNDPNSFYGGRYERSGATSTATTNYLKKYSIRYGSTYYPSSPVDLDCDSVLALENLLSTMDMNDENRPIITEIDPDTGVARYESTDFIIGHSFKTTKDPLMNGLNSGSTGAPLEITFEFNGNPNATSAKEVQAFIQQTNTLFVKANGLSSVTQG